MTRLYTLLLLSALALAEDPADLQIRKANIVSEGTRLSASLYSLKSLGGKKLPSIVMCHGWGGTAAGLRPQAMDFARAGYFVVVFDYRGWGDSDSRLILTKPAPEQRPDHRFTAEVQEVREVVDPIEQTTDLQNVVHWIQDEAQADPARIGLWGSSYSGGHVIYVAARDHRVKALVSQVGAADSRWVVATEQARSETYSAATKRARGEAGYPPQGAKVIGNLRGAPISEKMISYAPVDDAANAPQCAMLFVVAEKEELFDNKDHALKAYSRATGPKKLVTIPGITHYGVYYQAREQATRMEIEWFDEHLKK